MSTKLRGPENATNISIEDNEYVVGEDGLFSIDNGEHVAILRRMGFRAPDEVVGGAKSHLAKRYPNVTGQMVQMGINISSVITAEGLLDIIEGQMAAFSGAPTEDEDDDQLDLDLVGSTEGSETTSGSDDSPPPEGEKAPDLVADPDFASMNRAAIVAWLRENEVEDGKATDDKDSLVALAKSRLEEIKSAVK